MLPEPLGPCHQSVASATYFTPHLFFSVLLFFSTAWSLLNRGTPLLAQLLLLHTSPRPPRSRDSLQHLFSPSCSFFASRPLTLAYLLPSPHRQRCLVDAAQPNLSCKFLHRYPVLTPPISSSNSSPCALHVPSCRILADFETTKSTAITIRLVSWQSPSSIPRKTALFAALVEWRFPDQLASPGHGSPPVNRSMDRPMRHYMSPPQASLPGLNISFTVTSASWRGYFTPATNLVSPIAPFAKPPCPLCIKSPLRDAAPPRDLMLTSQLQSRRHWH
ncbi:hypothetical protein IF1G_00208 [Cordyceps javanica]|uniref:Uncharacterized protein n=1 Tax=Cordyceps javanica TaxID=43265 RepID=A0A545VEX6_9HYPO|nr:hypothetical protein IF1G_00208 [Cordyceps javanica]